MDKMREEFEAWAKSEGYDLSKYTKGGLEGFYSNSVTGSAWLGWKSSRAALCVELPEPDATWWSAEVLDALDDSGVSYEQNKPLS